MPKLLGITDAVTTCEACGRKGLKKTVALDFDGEVRHYGCDCAAASLLGAKSPNNTRLVERHASALSYAGKWIAKYGADDIAILKNIAHRIRVRYCDAYVTAAGKLVIAGEIFEQQREQLQ